ncbi:MAG: glycosyltransferase [Chitinispirillia bacterium]|jgi:spore maturation protein CgeB
MNVVFFNSETLVTRELIAALKKRSGIRLIIINIPIYPDPNLANEVYNKFKEFVPGLVFSINDAGYDIEGKIHDLIVSSGSFQINWYHDYPFYDTIFKKRPYPLSPKRIDFVSELSYVNLLRSKGFNSYFLPLATDPSYFNIKEPRIPKRNIAFVGNSSYALMDNILSKELTEEIERFSQLLLTVKNAYNEDHQFNVRQYLADNRHIWKSSIHIPSDKFIFGIEWMVGYLCRRDFLVNISKIYGKSFMLFGDPYWIYFIDKDQVSGEACYYDNLCHYYRTTKINLNINRIQINTSFTQRHFDCKACGAFLLTDKRLCISQYFITEGKQKEMVEFESQRHCHELIDYYLEHEEEREDIAMRGREKILKYHTYSNRIEEMFHICKKEWRI